MSYYLVTVWTHTHFCVFRIHSKVKCQKHCALKPIPNKLIQTVTLLIHIREVLGSKLHRDITFFFILFIPVRYVQNIISVILFISIFRSHRTIKQYVLRITDVGKIREIFNLIAEFKQNSPRNLICVCATTGNERSARTVAKGVHPHMCTVSFIRT